MQQLNQTLDFIASATSAMKERFGGMVQTVWSSAEAFMDEYYGLKSNKSEGGSQVDSFNQLYEAIGSLTEK